MSKQALQESSLSGKGFVIKHQGSMSPLNVFLLEMRSFLHAGPLTAAAFCTLHYDHVQWGKREYKLKKNVWCLCQNLSGVICHFHCYMQPVL